MAAPLYIARTEGAVALAAATAKTILGIRAGASFALLLDEVFVGFDGTSGSAVPVLVEIGTCTFATNAPGTASTTVTPTQGGGRVLTHGMTAAKNWTTEPTVIAVLEEFLLHAQTGERRPIVLAKEYDTALNDGFVIRCTAPAGVNARAFIRVARC